MGTSLTGKQIKNTYKSLIKVSDNTEASASAKQLSDGNGNDFGVYIDTDGVFGIGSAPSYSLDISSQTDGVALPVGTTANRPTASAGLLRYNSTIGKVEFYDTGWKTIFTTSGGTISGDVTVTGDLVVQGTTVTLNTETVQFEDNILMLNRASDDTQYNATNAGIEIEKTSATNPSFLYTYSDSTWNATDNFKIEGDLTVDTDTLFVDSSNDRVGIGTDSPASKMHVDFAADFDGLRIQNSSRGHNYLLTTAQSNAENFSIYDIDNNANLMQVGYAQARIYTNNTERMRIDSNGDVDIKGGSLTLNQAEVINFKNAARDTTWGQIQGLASGTVFSFEGTEQMRLDSGGDISFRDTSNNEAFYWDASAASLGIGTGSTPNAPLHILGKNQTNGTVELTPNAAKGSYSSYVHYGTNGDWYIRSANSSGNVILQDTGGNVGIGTASPDGRLDISLNYGTAWTSSSRANNFLQISNTNTTAGTYSGIELIATGTGSAGAAEIVCIDTGSGSGALAFSTRNSTVWGERMRIDSSGNVGIGTTSPAVLLDLDDGTTTDIRIRGNKTVDGRLGGIAFYNTPASDVIAAINVDRDGADDAGAITFDTQPTGGGNTERMRIDSNGNVGINITNPSSYSFNGNANIVAGNTSGNGTISIVSSTTGNGYLAFADGTSGADRYRGSIEYFHSDDDMAIRTAGSERMRIKSGGNVLIGKTTDDDNTNGVRLAEFGLLSASRPSNVALVLNRTGTDGSIAYFRNDGTQVGDISVSGTTTSYNTSSDYRLKEDAQDFDGLSMVNDISVYDFKWKKSDKRSYGVFAHELQEVLPQAVNGEKDGEETQSVDYSKIVPILTKALQEQQEIINDLKARIETLENQ